MDVTQQPSERKERYKVILDHLQNLRDENTETDSSVECLQNLQEQIRNSDNLHQEGTYDIEELVNNNGEVLMDAQVLKSAHEVLSKVLSANSEFNDRMYANALKSLVYHGDTMNWDAIAEIAVKVSRGVYTKSSLLGAADVELKEHVVKERQKRNRPTAPTAEEKRPEVTSQLKRRDRDSEKLNMILKQVNAIFKATDFKPIPFYKLIIDPNNFMNSVYNAFQLSFLARDANIAIEKGPDSHPYVRCVRPEELPEGDATSQSICSLNMKFCQDMVRLYNIKEPMLQLPEDSSESDDDSDDDDDNDNDDDNDDNDDVDDNDDDVGSDNDDDNDSNDGGDNVT